METSPTTFPPMMRWVLWTALLSAVVVYYIVLNTAELEPSDTEEDLGLSRIFVVIGLLLVAIAVGIKYIVRNRTGKDGRPEAPKWADSAFIASLALAETPAIFGLVLGFSGSDSGDYLPLFILSIAGFAMLIPSFYFPRDPARVTDHPGIGS